MYVILPPVNNFIYAFHSMQLCGSKGINNDMSINGTRKYIYPINSRISYKKYLFCYAMLYIHILFFLYERSSFYNPKNGLQILRIQRGGIRNKSHRPARTILQASNGYISARTGAISLLFVLAKQKKN